ncbi:MAG: GNAT family N-acetyltransferase [Phycisphaerae bacterium]
MSLFVSQELGRRIEQCDCAILRDAAVSMRRHQPDLDLFSLDLAGGFAMHSLPGSPLNKVAGLGFEGTPTAEEWDDVEAAFADRQSALQVEVSTLADSDIYAALSERGFKLVGFESILGQRIDVLADADRSSSRPADNAISVARCESDDLEAWIDVVVSGFLVPDTQGVESHETFDRDMLEPVVREFAKIDGFLRYLARIDGQPAGAASMRVTNGIAQFCGSATLPEFRRRGVQTQFLATRVAEALASDAEIATVTTQPGSKSKQNSHKTGFDHLYDRAVFIKEPPVS